MAAAGNDGARRVAEQLTREGIAPPSDPGHPREVAADAWRSRHVLQCRDTHEAAVDDETFARVQAKRALRDRGKRGRDAEADGVVIPPENWFIDEGISGRSTKRRASYPQLLRRAEAQRDARRSRARAAPQPIERLYVWAFSRIARNMFDCLRALAVLDDADIDVVSLTEHDSGDRSMRKLIRPILAWLAERYSEELSTNVLRGMRSQAEKGRWVYGLPPHGYAVQDGTLMVTDATRARFEVVQRVFQMADEDGDGAARIAARLTREAIAPPSRADLPKHIAPHAWRAKHFACILKNAAYAGHLTHDGKVVARDSHEAAVDDAKVMNAPLLEQREQARLQRAALPSATPAPTTDTVDPEAFRNAIKEAWHDRPLPDRRQALDKLLDEVRLSPGGVHITYSLAGHHGHDPYAPPHAPMSSGWLNGQSPPQLPYELC